jgi:hypothetical protein
MYSRQQEIDSFGDMRAAHQAIFELFAGGEMSNGD